MEHKHDHTSFVIDLIGRLGPPIFAATLVTCLLADKLVPSHLLLMVTGVLFIAVHHWFNFHRNQKS